MLRALTIRDFVLIDRLELAFPPGLSVLTGETGAGKSILLDALGLALGARADGGFVRPGKEQAVVAAEFDVPSAHPAHRIVGEQGLAADDTLLLRRVIGRDGRSRAFINDEPVSVGLLRRVGDCLVEIQGQSEQHGLLDPATHGALLDAFARLDERVAACRAAWQAWRGASAVLADARAALDQARRDEDYLRHAAEELARLDPKAGEEQALSDERALLMNREKVAEALQAAAGELGAGRGVDGALRAAQRHVERIAGRAGGQLDAVASALERAAIEAEEALAELRAAAARLDGEDDRLAHVDERLFALRAAARKHSTPVESLPAVRDTLEAALAGLTDQADRLDRLVRAEAEARAAYARVAEALSAARRKAAKAFDKAVMAELPPLRLDKARFVTRIEPLAEDAWRAEGMERVAFEIATIPGVPPGPLARIASGGELSRFMLALRVVLAATGTAPTLIFDEVDAGIGGAVAAAVGARLARLAEDAQVLVVTHSPQVAARGRHHWRVAKAGAGSAPVTRVEPLDGPERREEIARMLSGARVTDEARAAADSLMSS